MTFKGTIAKEDFPTSEKRQDTIVTVPDKQTKKKCEEFIFCPLADSCDGFNCLNSDSGR